MKATVLQVRLDGKLKKEADAFFTEAGLDTTAAVRLFLRQSVIQRCIPFDIVGEDPFYSKANQKALKESMRQYATGKIVMHKLMES
ncbi:MAG: type II toxin-antitoxin system RelB/DinJ family antitoxin [Kiritimatiellaeota bacterium]|nr:type II toxin-antitoxin system RelB/DinJ family antitoxin [Kiritimatiellota bacterium]